TSYARTVKAKSFSDGVEIESVPTVKKGTTTIKVTEEFGWIKFKAPSTKTYTFTVSNAKTTNSGLQVVATLFQKATKTKLSGYKVKTNQGKRYHMLTFSARNAKKYAGQSLAYNGVKYKVVSKNYAKQKIQKGKTVYIRCVGNGNGRFNLSIK
ncbi:MAG: hypothetical protein Q4A07_08345, partial [Coriobacteriales bacterium]|nr:hypothetical protein [Coriobacteriales bacterium]